jgi:hypothetical protein
MHKHRYAQFDKPQRIVPEIPYELDEIVCQLLEKDPAARPPDGVVLFKQFDSLKRRLDRRVQNTEELGGNAATVAEQRTDPTGEINFPGPATLMSKLMREEIARQKRGSLLMRIIEHPAVLVLLLIACIGLIAWAMWPLDQDTLFERGARLMTSSRLSDMNQAWREYLEPLEKRFPEHPYKEELDRFRIKHESAKSPTPTEAQHFYQLGERLRQEGDERRARDVWSSMVTVFEGSALDRDWVQRAQKEIGTGRPAQNNAAGARSRRSASSRRQGPRGGEDLDGAGNSVRPRHRRQGVAARNSPPTREMSLASRTP